MYVPVRPQTIPVLLYVLRAHSPSVVQVLLSGTPRRLSRWWSQKVLVESALLSWLSKVNSGMLDNFLACKCAPRCLPASRAPAAAVSLHLTHLRALLLSCLREADGRGARAPRVQDGRGGRVDYAGCVRCRLRPRLWRRGRLEWHRLESLFRGGQPLVGFRGTGLCIGGDPPA